MLRQLGLRRIAFVIAALSSAGVVGPMRCTARAADPGRPALTGAERNSGPHANSSQSPRYGGRHVPPGGNVRVHVGPVLPYGSGPYNVPQWRDYPSRAGYHVVDRAIADSSRMTERTVPDAATFLAWALHAFRSRHYREAMRLVKHALVEDELDGVLYLVLSQTQLAAEEYQSAAESLARGLALLDRADWGYVVDNRHQWYANGDYESHLKALAGFIDQNPKATFARFLRGYHAAFSGREDAAKEDLQKAAESTRYVDAAFGLLRIMDGNTVDRLRFEELPRPMGSATEGSR